MTGRIPNEWRDTERQFINLKFLREAGPQLPEAPAARCQAKIPNESRERIKRAFRAGESPP